MSVRSYEYLDRIHEDQGLLLSEAKASCCSEGEIDDPLMMAAGARDLKGDG